MQRLFRLGREESGAEVVEFAMCAMILMGIMVGMIGFSLGMYTYHYVSSAAQQGMRFAIVRGHTWSSDESERCSTSAPPNFTMTYNCEARLIDIQNYVQNLATAGINPSNVTVSTSGVWPGTTPDGGTCSPANSQGCFVKVTVNYTFDFFKLFPLGNLSNWTMSATSQGVILE